MLDEIGPYGDQRLDGESTPPLDTAKADDGTRTRTDVIITAIMKTTGRTLNEETLSRIEFSLRDFLSLSPTGVIFGRMQPHWDRDRMPWNDLFWLTEPFSA